MENSNKSIDPNSGFYSQTKIFHSLRSTVVLPPQTTPLSAASFALSLQLSCPWCDPTALINSNTGQRILYSDFIQKTKTLAVSFQTLTGLSKGDTAFILSPTSILVLIIYFSLLSIGIVVSPASPSSTDSELTRQIKLSKPVIAFATSTTCSRLPNLRFGTILIDSLKFESMMTSSTRELSRVEVSQSDIAAIMYSSGTTGEVKGVMLTHRNLAAAVASYYVQQVEERDSAPVLLYTMPFFHVYGFFYSLKSVAVSETVVVMERFDLRKMMRDVEEFRVTNAAAASPIVVAMAKEDMAEGYDLRSLEGVGCGGSPLAKEVIVAFKAKFPFVRLLQAYGLTESTGTAFRAVTPEECERWGSVGRLLGSCQAKIVDPHIGIVLPPCNQGELWIRGPMIMKGYVGNEEATSATLLADGWLRTGELCYIDNEGFLFIVPPAELEQLLQSHPERVDAAVVPYRNDEVGQVPMAFVVRHPQSNLSEAQVMDFVAKQVAPYKKIRCVAFVNSIPKSPAGKILRKELRKIVIPLTFSKL
ncbi:hypothetical protein TEA_017303 [Camellia sinensis var. sinensis]|uniref:Uncharacterized protein n=1 Tax=Camellia sinensis var. sinensis TaxID=542762 RepID=A0A4S4ECP6_CAMSN|nr:hypothetical protein TEA_017303 [Camellia sinensis var. sinensis]